MQLWHEAKSSKGQLKHGCGRSTGPAVTQCVAKVLSRKCKRFESSVRAGNPQRCKFYTDSNKNNPLSTFQMNIRHTSSGAGRRGGGRELAGALFRVERRGWGGMGGCAYRVGGGVRRRRAVEGEEEALGGIGDAGGPVHCARPSRLHHPASMVPRLPSPQQTEKRENEGWMLRGDSWERRGRRRLSSFTLDLIRHFDV
jgi:hypothetical protein